MKGLVKYHSETSLQIKPQTALTHSTPLQAKLKVIKGCNYPLIIRARQLRRMPKTMLLSNEINNISTLSTCETKKYISKQNVSKPKKRCNTRNNISLSSSDVDNSDSDSVSSYEIRKSRFFNEDNSVTSSSLKESILDNSDDESTLKDNLDSQIKKYLIAIYNKNASNCNYITGAKYCNQCDIITNYRKIKLRTVHTSKHDVSIYIINNIYSRFHLGNSVKNIITLH
jgi:hypothetical protein